MNDTAVLDHLLKEPAALHIGGSPKVFLVRKADRYSMSRCIFLKHEVILAWGKDSLFHGRAKDNEGNWKAVLSAGSTYVLVSWG